MDTPAMKIDMKPSEPYEENLLFLHIDKSWLFKNTNDLLYIYPGLSSSQMRAVLYHFDTRAGSNFI